jgi:hypothetical protein
MRQIFFIQKNEEAFQNSKNSLCLRKADPGPSCGGMVFRPGFKKGYEKMFYVPNLRTPRLPKNLVEIMHLEDVDG